jgi:hypothetical protein
MRPTLATVVLVGLLVLIAKADDKPTSQPLSDFIAEHEARIAKAAYADVEKDPRLSKPTNAPLQKIGVLSYCPNKGGGYTFFEGGHLLFYSLPYMPSTYDVEYQVFIKEMSKDGRRELVDSFMASKALGTVGSQRLDSGGQVVYRSEMKVIASQALRREDTAIAKWSRDHPDGQFRLSIVEGNCETRLKLKSIVPVLEHAGRAR